MSLKDLHKKGTASMEVPVTKAEDPVAKRPVTGPGQLMAFRGEMMAAEDRIRELEDQVRDLKSSSIPESAIKPNPWQPRRQFADEPIRQLADSIAEIGLIHSVIVRRVQSLDTPTYQLVAGERRLRACRMIGMRDIPAKVIEVADADMAALALAENAGRVDLTAYETAIAIRNAEKDYPNRKSLSAALGIQRSDLYRYLAFFSLPDFILSDLDREPQLLGRDAAEAVASLVKAHGEAALPAVSRLWTRMRQGELGQGQLAPAIAATLERGPDLRVERDIRKLFVRGEQAGTITRDAGGLVIRLKSAALDPKREEAIRAFVEKTLLG